MAGVGRLGLRPPERVDQAWVESGGHRRRGGGRRVVRVAPERTSGSTAALVQATSRAPRRAAGTAMSTPTVTRRRRSRRRRAPLSCLGDGGHRPSVPIRRGSAARPSGGTRGWYSHQPVPRTTEARSGHPADGAGRDAALLPCSRGRLVATTAARRQDFLRRRRLRRRRGSRRSTCSASAGGRRGNRIPSWSRIWTAGTMPAKGAPRRVCHRGRGATRSPTAGVATEFHLTAGAGGRVHGGEHGGVTRSWRRSGAWRPTSSFRGISNPASRAGRSGPRPFDGRACSSSRWRR